MKLPIRVKVSPRYIFGFPFWQYTCPACGGRGPGTVLFPSVAQVNAHHHATTCPALAEANRRALLTCWNCDGAGRVGTVRSHRLVDSECLVCLGSGWITEPEPERGTHD